MTLVSSLLHLYTFEYFFSCAHHFWDNFSCQLQGFCTFNFIEEYLYAHSSLCGSEKFEIYKDTFENTIKIVMLLY